MKRFAIVLAAIVLQGCATPEQNILAGAAIGAVIGSEVSRQQQPQHYPQRPVIIHQPAPVIIYQPRPVYCHTVPYYDAYGYYRGERRICR